MAKKELKPTRNSLPTYNPPDVAGAIADLMALRDNPKRLSPTNIVTQCYEAIEVARGAGYSFTDIAVILGRRNLKISVRQLGEEYETQKQTKTGVLAEEPTGFEIALSTGFYEQVEDRVVVES